MSFESSLDVLSDPEKRVSSAQLVDFSNLTDEEVETMQAAWPEVEMTRRLALILEMADLAQDNIELNFDAAYKLALQDADGTVRTAAIKGLFEYEGRDLIPVLADLLRIDPDVEVRREAAIALGRYAVAGELGYLRASDLDMVKENLIESAEDVDEDERVRARAIEAVGAISGEDTENLIESIYDEDSLWMKVGAVDAMGRSANDMWLEIVQDEMTNAAPEMRHAAAFAAGEIGDEEAVPALKELALRDDDREVQLAAIHALTEIGGADARVALQNLLYEGDDDIREPIQEAIGELSFREDLMSPPPL